MKRKVEKVEVCPILRPVPLDYWETSDARQGGIIDRIDEKGLCVHSHVNMPVGRELPMRIFFSPGEAFDGFEVLVRVVSKDLCCQEGWETYDYELHFLQLSERGHQKLADLLKIRQLRKN
jgi:hypothetical protein